MVFCRGGRIALPVLDPTKQKGTAELLNSDTIPAGGGEGLKSFERDMIKQMGGINSRHILNKFIC